MLIIKTIELIATNISSACSTLFHLYWNASLTTKIWTCIGFLGQAFFSARFIIQWLKSEKQKKSIIPIAFWYLSIIGSSLLFAYAVYKKDPVFILGQFFGIFIYMRNLYFIKKEKYANT